MVEKTVSCTGRIMLSGTMLVVEPCTCTFVKKVIPDQRNYEVVTIHVYITDMLKHKNHVMHVTLVMQQSERLSKEHPVILSETGLNICRRQSIH